MTEPAVTADVSIDTSAWIVVSAVKGMAFTEIWAAVGA
jgi:hypothetical protein